MGLKARGVNGWTYEANNKESMFKEEYRHAWNEVLIGDKWICIDATMGASPPIKDLYKYFTLIRKPLERIISEIEYWIIRLRVSAPRRN